MNPEELSKEQLIDLVKKQADDVLALQMEIDYLKGKHQLQQIPVKEALKLQPVEVNGELWYFTLPRWRENGKLCLAEQMMLNEEYLQRKVAEPYQTILKKLNS